MPDCDAIIAGDRAEIASTQRMLFRETRTTLGIDFNCTSSFHSSANVNRPPASRPLAYIISDAGSDVEHTELLLRAVYAAANVYCLTIDFCSADEHVAMALRRLTSCFNNIITVEQACGSWPNHRNWNATTAAWWLCVNSLLRHGVQWTRVVSLTVGDFPLRPQDDIARRLATENFDVGRRTGNDVIKCGAFTRSAVSRPSTTLRRIHGEESKSLSASSITTSRIHSPDGVSVIEVCARKCRIVNDDISNARCYYTVADLTSLVRQRKLFAHAFNLNVDHYALRCLMQRTVTQKNE